MPSASLVFVVAILLLLLLQTFASIMNRSAADDVTTVTTVAGTPDIIDNGQPADVSAPPQKPSTMNEKEEKIFHEMADKDKMRYNTNMQSYIPLKGKNVYFKKQRPIKDPNAPKRSLSAFFWFCNDEREKFDDMNRMNPGDEAKHLAKLWHNADITVKQKYEAIAEKDKARYEREMTEYTNEGKATLFQQMVIQKQQQNIVQQQEMMAVENETDEAEECTCKIVLV